MYKKIGNMVQMTNDGLNVHRWFVPNTFEEYLEIIKELQHCSIRTDHAKVTENLPFYTYDIHKELIIKALNVWVEAEDKEYKLLISDGIKYDPIQEYNMVVMLRQNGDFFFDASEMKVPLRHMYKYPLLSCNGNLSNNIHSWDIMSQKYGLDKTTIKKDLLELYNYGIFDKWLEVTKYPIPVGIKNQNIIFWQII